MKRICDTHLIGNYLARMAAVWRAIRQLSGDDAFERYLRHCAEHHAGEPPLSKKEFFRQWQEGKWRGVKRCC